MIVFQIYVGGIGAFKFECDPPVSSNAYRVSAASISLELMKMRTGKIHVLRRGCGMQAVEDHGDALGVLCLNAPL